MQEMNLEQRVIRIEKTLFTVRIAIIIFVGFLIYDIVSQDTGSSFVFADRVTSREFILLGADDEPVGYWDFKNTNGLKIYSEEGNHIVITPEAATFYEDRLNPVVKSKYE